MDSVNRILVTGGGGFIGSHVVGDLLTDGIEVGVIDNFTNGKRSLVPEKATLVTDGDVESKECFDGIVAYNPDAIVHLAARHYIPFCQSNPLRTFQANVMGTRNVCNAASQCNGIQSLVFASSAAVYGPNESPHAEDESLDPIDVYGETKVIGEDLVELFGKSNNFGTCALRLSNVYGQNETNDHLIPDIIKQLPPSDRGIELGNLSPARDFVHVTDVSRAIQSALEGDFGGHSVFNVGTGIEHTVREVVEMIGEVYGTEIHIQQDASRKRESDRPHLRLNISKARQELNWEPEVDFSTGLDKLVNELIYQ